jgi:muconate cycloisomerase
MQLDRITVHHVLLPFTQTFAHSLRKRFSVRNVVVEVVAEKGKIRGYGEGAPRSYVTGESQASVTQSIATFVRTQYFPWEFNEVTQIWDFIDSLPEGKEHNSALCALESALLDALGRYQNRYLLDYFPQDFRINTFCYGAPLPLSGKEVTLLRCQTIKKMGIKKLKLKLGKDFQQNREIFESVHHVLGEEYDLRVDVNCVWDTAIAKKHLPLLQKYGVRVVEQPTMTHDTQLTEIADFYGYHGIILMADESACTLEDVERLSQEGFYQMVNIRLSKCGGLRQSSRIIDYLRQREIAFQIGCHFGESGVLSAAGRVLCLLCGDALYYEGSYDEVILARNITSENVSFGPEGRAQPLTGSGLGVEVNRQDLHRLSNAAATFTPSTT